MRKGEQRRLQILNTAERLFMTKGYEATTVQDILDDLKLSKGGFYHHFLSKEELLEAICDMKAEGSFLAAKEAVEACPGTAVDKLNAMFDKNGIWQEDQVDFLCLFIRVAYRDGNLITREKLKMANMRRTLPLFNEIVKLGVSEGVFYTPFPESIGQLLLQLGQNLTDEIAMMLAELGPSEPDMVHVLERLELYRHAIEKLLDAPYGSIVLFQMRRMAEICDLIYVSHMKEAGLALSPERERELRRDLL